MLHRFIEPGGQLGVRRHNLSLQQLLQCTNLPKVQDVHDRKLVAKEFGVRAAKLIIELI